MFEPYDAAVVSPACRRLFLSNCSASLMAINHSRFGQPNSLRSVRAFRHTGRDMTPFSHPQPGVELDWLAVDLNGHVGLFSTGGQGPVPRLVVVHLAQVEAAVRRLTELPILGPCAESPSGGGTFEFWIEPCRRGLFGFDWGPVPVGPYARFTVPSRAVQIGEIEDPRVREAAELVRLPTTFAGVTAIDVDDLSVALFRT